MQLVKWWICLLSFSCLLAVQPESTSSPAPAIQLPSDFVIEKIAGSPLIKHPLHVAMDDQGNCYVTEMAGVNRNGKELEKDPPNGIKLLKDTDGDGIYDQAITFADKMTFPGGVLWHNGAVYATSFPYLWKLVDKNGDGQADERIPLVGKFGSVGNGADLHGPQLGPDGWLYFCDGRNGYDCTLADGRKIKGRASGLYRCKPDGSGLERVFAGGMDNPVEVAFTPTGEPLVCTNLILNKPRHDGLLFGLEGAVYPYDLGAVKELKWTGQYMPIMGELGWVAVSSIVRQTSPAWGSENQDKYFVAEFNTHRIRKLTINRQGASFAMQAEPFLSCTDPDFHPTQLVQVADGSMLLVDTGGWFRNGCPTSQIEKPSIHGGIYRIRKKNQSAKGKRIPSPWPNCTVDEARSTLQKNDVAVKLDALWSLGRQLAIGPNEEVQQVIRSALADQQIDVLVLALRMVGQYRDVHALDSLVRLVKHPDQAVRRETATALGRLKHVDGVAPLIQALENAEDPWLEHAIIYALIQINEPSLTASGLKSYAPRVQRGVMLALDQMPGEGLTWTHLSELMQTTDARLRQSALEVMVKHPEWVTDLADYAERKLSEKSLHRDAPAIAGMKQLLTALATQEHIQQLMADKLACPEESGLVRSIILDAMLQADLVKWPKLWNQPLNQFLENPQWDNELLMQGILVAGASKQRHFDESLRKIAEQGDRPLSTRLSAATIALKDGKPVGDSLFNEMMLELHPESEPALRLNALQALSGASLSSSQLNRLLPFIKHAGPMELPILLTVWEHRSKEIVWPPLLEALLSSPGLPAVSLDRLQTLIRAAPAEYQTKASLILTRGRPDLAAQKTRLRQLESTLTGGDVQKGREIFFSSKAVCSTCHRVGNEGGLIGPNLSTIGSIRTRGDLLESILFPNASLARGYETLVIVTKDGKTITGVLTRETVDALVLTDSQRAEHKVLRQEIEQMTASSVSTMPAGMDQTLSAEELRDLLAWLATLK